MEEENKLTNIKEIKAVAPFDKLIPKYCTSISFAVTQDKQFIISLVFQEGDQNIMIERVAITHEHAKGLSKTLNDLLEKIKNDGSTNQTKTK